MTIYFAPTLDCLPYLNTSIEELEDSDDTTKGFLYMFHTDPQSDNINAYVKVGRTEETLLVSRLKSYLKEDANKRTVIPINIYYSKPTQYLIRETILKRLCSNHSCIKLVEGTEYFYGNYNILKTLFVFVSTISENSLQNVLESYMSYLNPNINKELLDIGKDKEIIYTTTQNAFNKEEWMKKWIIYLRSIDSTCSYCNKNCNTKQGLSSHLKKCKENISLECKYCHHIFSSKATLFRHYTSCENRKYLELQNALNALKESNAECENLKIENEKLKQQLDEATKSYCCNSNTTDEFKRLLEERKMLYNHIQLLERLVNKSD